MDWGEVRCKWRENSRKELRGAETERERGGGGSVYVCEAGD